MDNNSMNENDRAKADVTSARARIGAAAQTASMFGGRKPSSEMAQVLDMFESLHGKPVPTLDAAEARKQPSPADAVKKLLEGTEPERVGEVDNRSFECASVLPAFGTAAPTDANSMQT